MHNSGLCCSFSERHARCGGGEIKNRIRTLEGGSRIIADGDFERRQTGERTRVMPDLRMARALQRKDQPEVIGFRQRTDQRAAHSAGGAGDRDADGGHGSIPRARGQK